MKSQDKEKHEANRSKYHMFGHTLLRVTIGVLFIITGYNKLLDPNQVSGMLSGITLFAWAAVFWTWVLIISELLFGVLILIGYKVKYTTLPLAFVLLVAVFTITIPNAGWTSTNALFHYISIAGLISLSLTGPGEWAISKSR